MPTPAVDAASAVALRPRIGGWYAPPSVLPGDAQTKKDGHANLWMRSCLSRNELASRRVHCRRLLVWWTPGDSTEVVAHATAVLVGCKDPTATNAELVDELDALSQDAYDFGRMLVRTYAGEVPEVFNFMRHLAHFELLELREDYCDRGLGIGLGQQFVDLLDARYQTGLVALKPHPLQYDLETVANTTHDRLEHLRKKLRDRYQRCWGAQPWPGNPEYLLLLGRGRPRGELLTGPTKWKMVGA